MCVAGVDEQGKCVRPVMTVGLRRRDLSQAGRLIIYPGAKLQLALSPAKVTPPHSEDRTLNSGSMVSRGSCTATEWEGILRATWFPNLAEIFGGHLQADRKVKPGAATRSLGTIGDVRIVDVTLENPWGPRFQLDFVDASGKSYHQLPVRDLAFRAYCLRTIGEKGDVLTAERDVRRTLTASRRVYLRIGLARPWRPPEDSQDWCWTQVTGVYTFPDCLGGKTFAELT